jgi:hypothetical protein
MEVTSDKCNEPEMPASRLPLPECATCNYKAREYGIKEGMYLGKLLNSN